MTSYGVFQLCDNEIKIPSSTASLDIYRKAKKKATEVFVGTSLIQAKISTKIVLYEVSFY